MEPLLFADHLRRMRKSADETSGSKRPAFNFSGTLRLVGAACAASLLLVMLQVALSAPLAFPAGAQLAALAAEEAQQ